MNERIHTIQPSVEGTAADIMHVICLASCLRLNDVTLQVSEFTMLKREDVGQV